MATEKVDSKLQSICRKTRLCKFYAQRSCTRGSSCSFAHCADELKAIPDLSCTKLCPALVSTGVCSNPACKFAHDRAELRSALARMSAWQGGGGGGADCDAGATPPARQAGPEDAATGGRGGRPGGGRRGLAAVAPGPPPAPPEAPRGRAPAGRRGAPPPEVGAPLVALEGARANPERRVKFHRTKLCQFFLQGRCSKREKCDFAHGEAELQARRAAARGAGRGGDVGAPGIEGAARPRARGAGRGGGGGPLCAPAGEEVLFRTPSDETMCSFLTTSTASTIGSTIVRSSSPGSSSDSAAWPEQPPEPPELAPAAPAEERPLGRAAPPEQLRALAPPTRCSPPRWSSEGAKFVPLARSVSQEEDVEGCIGGRADFVTTVKNTFITVYMGPDDDDASPRGETRRRSKSATSTPSREREP